MAAFPASGLAPWLAEYAAADVLAGREIDVDWAGERLHGVARGIDAQGALLVDCDGVRRPLWGGEVTVRAGRGSAA
jgi:BirA family biotin operon repressor/biotin-[acetyl-CoA-carboxylase] ligase